MDGVEAPLRKIGLTSGEARVYAALLGLGPSSSGSIVRESGVSGSKVYPILDRLAGMDLVSRINRNGKKIFCTTSPERILELLEKRQAEIESQKNGIKKALPALMRRHMSLAPRHEAAVYEGYRGVKTYYNSLLKALEKGDERLVFGARSGYPVAKSAQYFFQNYQKGCGSKGIKTRC